MISIITLVHNLQSSAHLPVISTPAALLEVVATLDPSESSLEKLESGELIGKRDHWILSTHGNSSNNSNGIVGESDISSSGENSVRI